MINHWLDFIEDCWDVYWDSYIKAAMYGLVRPSLWDYFKREGLVK